MITRLSLVTVLLSSTSISAQPTIEWSVCLGGTAIDQLNAIQQTTDGGYITVGFSMSNDGDLTANYGMTDLWVVKLDPTGGIQL